MGLDNSDPKYINVDSPDDMDLFVMGLSESWVPPVIGSAIMDNRVLEIVDIEGKIFQCRLRGITYSGLTKTLEYDGNQWNKV